MPDFMMILTVLWNITRAAVYFIDGVVRALIPSEYLPKKDISNEIALVTGAGKKNMLTVRVFVANMCFFNVSL